MTTDLNLPDISQWMVEQQPDLAVQRYGQSYGLPPGLQALMQQLLPRIQRNYMGDLADEEPENWPTFQDWLPSTQSSQPGFRPAQPGGSMSPWDYINQLIPAVLQNMYRGGQATRRGII